MSYSFGRKRRSKGFKGTSYRPVADQPVEQPAEERPITASSRKLTVEPPPSTSFTSGSSRVLLRPRPTKDGGGEASSSVTETGNPELSGNRLLSCSSIVSIVSQLKCPSCSSSLSVTEDFSSRRGLVTRIKVQCSTDCGWFHYLSDSYDKSQTIVNTQLVLAARTVGMSQTLLTTFCGMMDMPPPICTKAYANCNKLVLAASNKEVMKEHLAAAAELHEMSAAGTLYVPPPFVEPLFEAHSDSEEVAESCSEFEEDESDCDTDDYEGISDLSDSDDCEGTSDLRDSDDGEGTSDLSDHEDAQSLRPGGVEPIDVTVTFDGTWSKRGFTALYGVGVVTSLDTGCVLDMCTLSRYCGVCAYHRAKLNTVEFKRWYETHKSSCKLNHSHSSPSMEAAAGLILWNRSVSRLNLRYVNVVSDGDSKTIKDLREAQPYGEGVTLTKYECVGHVQKRLGKAVIKLRTKPPMENVKVVVRPAVKARKATKKRPARKASREVTKTVLKKVQVGGRNGITKKIYKILQQYYGNAIRQHAGDLDGMVEACWAVYYHSISTDDDPQHHCCPKSMTSWCFYQRAMACSLDVPHHLDPTHKDCLIPLRLAQHIKPIFERLCDRSLLEGCVLGATQNQNESFNSVVWLRCSKTDFCSPDTVNLAVNLQ